MPKIKYHKALYTCMLSNKPKKLTTLRAKKATTPNPQVFIGIDPDADKNGVAMFDSDTKALEATALTFPDTLDYLRYTHSQARAAGRTLVVIIEAGWLNKTHWHVGYKDSQQAAAAKGNAVGGKATAV